MVAAPLLLVALFAAPSAPADSLRPPGSAPPDSTSLKVVRHFPAVEVHAPPADVLWSNQTVHSMGAPELRLLPADGFTSVLALRAGVVAVGEQLHVRGGRSGETAQILDGVVLDEPLTYRTLELPLLAIASADLVSGTPDARYASGLAGVLDVHTMDPTARPSGEIRWQTDGRTDTHYDRVGARLAAPLLRGLGIMAAGEAMLDDTYQPSLRTDSRRDIAGMSFGWRAENRMLGVLKLAPVDRPRRFSAQLVANRQVHRPYDPQWSLDGWSFLPADPKAAPIFSPTELPGYQRWQAADHMSMTDERGLAALVTAATQGASTRASASVGWLRYQAILSPDGRVVNTVVSRRPSYGNGTDADQFHVLWGEDALYRESESDRWSARGDGELSLAHNATVKAGLGATYDHVRVREIEWLPLGLAEGGEPPMSPLDSIRTFTAWAPGAFAYVQGRWLSGGMVLQGGLRADWFTPGPQAGDQTLPGNPSGVLSLSPRFGVAYPISVRDAFSLSYVRMAQAPPRNTLYDNRYVIGNRQPLGNAALVPATVISYEAAVRHLFEQGWSTQTSLFYRDLYGQVGARAITAPDAETNLTYTNRDEGHAIGFELSLTRAAGPRRRFEARYTWLEAYGNESHPNGDPFGQERDPGIAPISDLPLSWDRRHSLVVAGAWDWRERWAVSWTTAVGSALPWTPKPVREPPDDPTTVNSERLGWVESTSLDLRWSPRLIRGVTLGIEARNLFNHRNELAASVDGFPNPLINTTYDDYGAYRTETGNGGGAYLATPGDQANYWVPVHDARLFDAPRAVRASVDLIW